VRVIGIRRARFRNNGAIDRELLPAPTLVFTDKETPDYFHASHHSSRSAHHVTPHLRRLPRPFGWAKKAASEGVSLSLMSFDLAPTALRYAAAKIVSPKRLAAYYEEER
jgi:hypothetical protein